MESVSPWNIPVENTTLSICCNGDNTALIRIFMGTTLVGFVQSIKFEADMNKTYPVIEIKFADLGLYVQSVSNTLVELSREAFAVAALIKNVFPDAKIIIGETKI